MAEVRILTWNIQVYGPKKYSHPMNGVPLLNLIGAVANSVNANIVIVVEEMTSVAQQIGFNFNESLDAAIGGVWESDTRAARRNGNRESYATHWRTGAGFAPTRDANQRIVAGWSNLEFPNNFSDRKGRLAAYVAFTTNGQVPFVTTAYHAPANQQAEIGLERLPRMPELYDILGQRVSARLLAGDYNVDINQNAQKYSWITNPEPAQPPPSQVGQGAGCAPATRGNTLLATYDQVVGAWGQDPTQWAVPGLAYTQQHRAIDNVLWTAQGANGAGRVVDVISAITEPATPIGAAARTFRLQDPQGNPAFVHADKFPGPMNASLHFTGYAYLLYRYAISDHLPVFLSLTI